MDTPIFPAHFYITGKIKVIFDGIFNPVVLEVSNYH